MPQNMGNGLTRWAPNESKAFFKHWDSPERRAQGQARKAEYNKMSAYDQKKHSRRQRGAIRKAEGTNFSFKQWNHARQHGDAGAQRNQEAGLQKRADWSQRREAKKDKKSKRRKQRMAGDVFQK